MNDVANQAGAIEPTVTDVNSAAAVLEARAIAAEEPVIEEAQEVTEPVETETDELTEEVETEDEGETTEETGESNTEESDDSTDEREAESEEVDPQFHSVDELAEATDQSTEQFLENVKVKVKVNGEEKEVNLAEAVKGYQLESDYRQKTMELADSKREFEGAAEQAKAELSTKLTEATNMVANLEQSILAEFNNVDWSTLRATDPGEYAALQTEYNTRYQSLQQMKGQTAQQFEHLQAEQRAKQEAQRNEFIQKESQALIGAIPEWNDADVATAEKEQLRGFLKEYGFNDGEISELADHRMVLLLRDASKGKKAITKTNIALKKVSKAPKLQKPNAKTSKTTQRQKANNDLKAKLRKSGGHVDDVAALLLARSS